MKVTDKAAAPLIAVSVLLAACGSPQSTVEGFYRAIDAGDVEKALEYIDPGSRQMWGGKLTAAVAVQVEKIDKCGGIDEIKIEQVSERGDLRIVKAKVVYKDAKCGHKSEKLKLIKSGGSWRIVVS